MDGIGSVALTPEENRALHNKCAWTTLNRRLEKISKSSQKLVVRRSPNDLVSYLEIYTYDEIKSVVDALDDDRKSIVYKKCGPMLNGEGSFQLTSEETKKFTSILARIKVRLNKKRNPVDGRSKRSSNLSSVNLIKKFENELTVEEIEKIVSMLNDKHQDIIHLVCGEKLDGNTSHIITLEDKKKYRSALNMLVHFSKKIKEDPNYVRKEQKSKNNLLDYFDNKYTYEMIKEVFDTLDEKHQEIIIKKCGLMFDGVGSLKLSREEGDIFTINAFPALKWRLEKKYREVNNIKLKEVVKISGLHRARKSLIDNLKVSC